MKGRLSKLIDIKWKPDKSSDIPLYLQIVDYFSEQVASGQWGAEYRLPSQRDLANHLGVNRSTVSTAIDELIAMGILKAEIGRGTFVDHNLWESPADISIPRNRGVGGWNIHRYNGLFIENTDSMKMVNGLLGRDDDYINLDSNLLSEELSPIYHIRNSLNDLSKEIDSLSYLPPSGHYGLREEVAKKLAGDGIDASPQNILITSGSAQALNLISMALLKRDTTLFTEDPSYINTHSILRFMGMDIKKVPMDDEGISVDELSKVIKRKDMSLIYTMPNYQDPTNILMSKDRRKELMNWCLDNKVVIVEDDAYGDMWHDEEPPRPLKSMDKDGLVLYLGNVSQTLSTGFRLGWIVGPESVIKRLSDVKMQTDYSTSPMSQIIVKQLFESGIYDVHLRILRHKLKVRRNTMLNILDKNFCDIGTWDVPKGGYHIWLKLNKKLPATKLFNYAFERKLLLDPNMEFGDKDVDAIRLSYSFIGLSHMAPALETLKEIIIKLQSERS